MFVANGHAMRSALALAQDLSVPTVLALHRALLAESDPEIAGRWRTEPVWIGRSALSPWGPTTSPRGPRSCPRLVEDLMAWAARPDLPVLAQAAVAHAQFETIHPFSDGNGRTGRALLHAMLRHHGLVRRVTVPVSAGLLADVRGYHAALTAYRAGDPDVIVEPTVEATFRAVTNGRELAAEVDAVRERWRTAVTARRDSAVWRGGRPVPGPSRPRRRPGGRRQRPRGTNVHRHLERLTEAGVLTPFPLHRRGRAWRADEVLHALDAFAARAGRNSSNQPRRTDLARPHAVLTVRGPCGQSLRSGRIEGCPSEEEPWHRPGCSSSPTRSR